MVFRITFRIAEAFELDPIGMLLGGACLPAKRFGSERSEAGNALLVDVGSSRNIKLKHFKHLVFYK